MARAFEDRPAVREHMPLLIGLVGPSGTGKTYSALRLATGIQRVSGGDIFCVDTEARRSLHYAERFKFRHLAFGAPFASLDFLAAIEHCVKKGAKNIIVDSMSLEHEGPGGVLEEHALEQARLAKAWGVSEAKANMPAWAEPKRKRRRMINALTQMSANFIFCFRAKEKLKIVTGKEPENRGFLPIAGEEFVYELTLKCLLLPGANGVPTWQSENVGERMMMKLPEQFRTDYFRKLLANTLSEDTGEALAKWAAGAPTAKPPDAEGLVRQYEACSDPATYRVLEEARRTIWASAGKDAKGQLKTAAEGAAKRIEQATMPALESEPPPGRQSGDD
jgi:ABC-type dipeptide/oligopeptide/nickel transport system ATPase subunit